MSRTILTFVDDLYEDLELWYPRLRLEEAGYQTRFAGSEMKTLRGKHGYPATAEALLNDVKSADFLGLLIPGGFIPDQPRRHPQGLSLTREFFEQGKMV